VAIDESERTLIRNVLKIRDSTVSDVMVPRIDIVAIAAETSYEKIIDIMTSKGHSRLPIYRDGLDDVVGMVHIKDIVAWRGQVEKFSIDEVQRNILFVSPSMPVLELLLEMRVTRTHMAIVVDEYGGVDGLLTIEDLVEEIVGDIADEHDIATPGIHMNTDGSYVVDGTVTIRDLNRECEWNLPDEDAATIAGLILHESRRIPDVGQAYLFYGFRFEILNRQRHQIVSIKIIPTADSPEFSKIAD